MNNRCALYARVSKDKASSDGKLQDPTNQLVPMHKFANAMGWHIVGEWVDYTSGGTCERPKFQNLMAQVRQRNVDIILVWALDRFSREGILNTLKYLRELSKYKCGLKSIQEQWLDTTDTGMGQLLIAIMSWFAKLEREKISERTKAGLAQKRKQGVRLGRPTKGQDPNKVKLRILQLYDDGLDMTAISRELNVSWYGVKRILLDAGKRQKNPTPCYSRFIYKEDAAKKTGDSLEVKQ